MRFLCFIVAVFVTLAVPSIVFAQRNSECDIQRSTEWPEKVDVYCDCMQSLTQMNLNIGRLTINQHECPEKSLQLFWSDLETHVAPSSFVIEGATVHFGRQDPSHVWNSSIINLEFKRCSFGSIPAYAFAGLEALETLRISLSSIDVIQSGVFSKLSQLHLIEITNSTVAKVSERSFADLPSLRDLALAYSAFEEISSEAVYLTRLFTGDAPRCGNLGRSLSNDAVLTEIMGRQLPSSGNLSLPEFGTRLFLFKNSIRTLRSLAISSETLGFLIAAGNNFETIESAAFNMELYNECEISAALFVSNVFQNLKAEALVGLRGRDGSTFQTFIALTNNTFRRVEERGFMLSKNLVIFTVESNSFHCKCDNFDWILSNADSPYQRELEKELVLKGTCQDGTNLVSYTSLCTDNGDITTVNPTSLFTDNGDTTTVYPTSRFTDNVDITTVYPEDTTKTPNSAGLTSSISAVTSLITLALCVLFA